MTGISTLLRRSPLERLGDTLVADQVDAAAIARRLAIADLSMLPRLGFKGRGTIEAMKKRDITVEATPNRAFRQANGGLCLVLGAGEVMLLANLRGEGEKLAAIEADWRIEDEERTYPLLRQDSHFWLCVSGSEAPAMFAKLCAIDLRVDRFTNLEITQTSVARLNAIVARADLGKTPAFHVLADSASALYFSSCLIDAAREFGGRMVGLGAMRELDGE